METLFEAAVFWAYDHELEAKSGLNQIAAQFSGVHHEQQWHCRVDYLPDRRIQ